MPAAFGFDYTASDQGVLIDHGDIVDLHGDQYSKTQKIAFRQIQRADRVRGFNVELGAGRNFQFAVARLCRRLRSNRG